MIVHLKSTAEKIDALIHDVKFLNIKLSKHKRLRNLKAFQTMLVEMQDIIEEMIKDMYCKKRRWCR